MGEEEEQGSGAEDAVEKVTDKGWMLGDDRGNFNPNEPVTRAELAVALNRILT